MMQGVIERTGIKQRVPAKGKKKSGVSGGQTTLPLEEGGRSRSFLHRWSAVGLILLASVLAVLFVANAIHVNDLLRNVTSVEAERDEVRRENERLRAELTRLMSVEQITERAAAIGMIQPERPPIGLSPKRDQKGIRE
ncbi:MAG: FtsL-like putative cell division protein [Candidatus Kapaibacterium sp.]